MRTLLIEPTPAGSASVAHELDAAGHQVVRCHPADGPSFPCSGLTHTGCPLDDGQPIDVAIAVRDEPTEAPRADEGGVTCAIRNGIPVVVLGAPGANPFAEWAETCHDPSELPGAVDRAIVAAGERRAAPLQAEAERLVEDEGIDPGRLRVDVVRDGDLARIVIRTEQPLPVDVANAVATRLHAVDQRGSWPTTKVSVAIASFD